MLGIHSVYNIRESSTFNNMLLFEVLTMVLSTQYWKKYNGPIKLYCDNEFYDIIKNLDLLWLWDDIDNTTLKQLPKNVNYDYFWAYPKIHINSIQTEPFTNLDIDLYNNRNNKESDDILFCNIEKCDNTFYYPEYHKFKDYNKFLLRDISDDYAANVALLQVKNLDFYSEYYNVVKHFVTNNWNDTLNGSHNSSLMTFIEQRLLYSMIKEYGFEIVSQVDGIYNTVTEKFDDGCKSNGITHLWGWKSIYRNEDKYKDRVELTIELKNEIIDVFPNIFPKLKQVFKYVGV